MKALEKWRDAKMNDFMASVKAKEKEESAKKLITKTGLVTTSILANKDVCPLITKDSLEKFKEVLSNSYSLIDNLRSDVNQILETEVTDKMLASFFDDSSDWSRILDNILLSSQFQLTNDKKEKATDVFPEMNEVTKVYVLGQGLAAFTSSLSNPHIRHLSKTIETDIFKWISKIFRFSSNTSGFFHHAQFDGSIKICRKVLHAKYPELSRLGYAAFLEGQQPIIFLSSASDPQFRQQLCIELGLPLTSLCIVPSQESYKFSESMDIKKLQDLINKYKLANRRPLLLLAYAGTPTLGHLDNFDKLLEICRENDIWLHVEGDYLSTLATLSVPTNVISASYCDSMTLNIGAWLALPSTPFITLSRVSDSKKPSVDDILPNEADENECAHTDVSTDVQNCLPLWIAVQHLSQDGIMNRIENAFTLAKHFTSQLQEISTIRLIRKVKIEIEATEKPVKTFGIREYIFKFLKQFIVVQMVNPTIIFRCQIDRETGTSTEKDLDISDHADFTDAANEWVVDSLSVHQRCPLTTVHVDGIGTCIRYSFLDTAAVCRTSPDDIDQLMKSLKESVKTLNAVFALRLRLSEALVKHANLKVAVGASWNGVGSVRYTSAGRVESVDRISTVEEDSSIDVISTADRAETVDESVDEVQTVESISNDGDRTIVDVSSAEIETIDNSNIAEAESTTADVVENKSVDIISADRIGIDCHPVEDECGMDDIINSRLVDRILQLSSSSVTPGKTDGGSSCVKIGMITDYNELEAVLQTIEINGDEIRRQIQEEKLTKIRLKQEEDAIYEQRNRFVRDVEGRIKQVIEEIEKTDKDKSVFGSLMSWWSPASTRNGKTFNLDSGILESTNSHLPR